MRQWSIRLFTSRARADRPAPQPPSIRSTTLIFNHPVARTTVGARIPQLSPIIPAGSRAAEFAARPEPVSSDPETTITFTARRSRLPALRSAVEEISSIVGARLEGAHRFAKEHALTDAAIALGSLRAAVNAATPNGDQNYV